MGGLEGNVAAGRCRSALLRLESNSSFSSTLLFPSSFIGDPVTRVFTILALLSLVALGTNIVLGLRTGDLAAETRQMRQVADQYKRTARSLLKDSAEKEAARVAFEQARSEFQPKLARLTLHIWVGIVAGLLTLLVNAVAITYFLGTARWCREVVETYDLDRELAQQSLAHKRRVFFLAFISMAVILAIVVFGALADPVRSYRSDLSELTRWRLTHFFLALLGTGWIGLAYYWQIQRAAANARIIRTIMEQVEQKATETILGDQT